MAEPRRREENRERNNQTPRCRDITAGVLGLCCTRDREISNGEVRICPPSVIAKLRFSMDVVIGRAPEQRAMYGNVRRSDRRSTLCGLLRCGTHCGTTPVRYVLYVLYVQSNYIHLSLRVLELRAFDVSDEYLSSRRQRSLLREQMVTRSNQSPNHHNKHSVIRQSYELGSMTTR
jgi:hypothetical protein